MGAFRALLLETRALLIECLDRMQNATRRLVAVPRTEEIGRITITTAKNLNNFSHSNYISTMLSRESPNFQTSFHVSKWSPRHSKDLLRNRLDLEIHIFQVWSPPWAVCPAKHCIFVEFLSKELYFLTKETWTLQKERYILSKEPKFSLWSPISCPNSPIFEERAQHSAKWALDAVKTAQNSDSIHIWGGYD